MPCRLSRRGSSRAEAGRCCCACGARRRAGSGSSRACDSDSLPQAKSTLCIPLSIFSLIFISDFFSACSQLWAWENGVFGSLFSVSSQLSELCRGRNTLPECHRSVCRPAPPWSILLASRRQLRRKRQPLAPTQLHHAHTCSPCQAQFEATACGLGPDPRRESISPGWQVLATGTSSTRASGAGHR